MYWPRLEVPGVTLVFVFLAVSSYCFHLVRNISELYAVIPVVISIFGVLFCFSRRGYVDRSGSNVVLVFILSYMLPVIYSFVWYPDEVYFIPVVRYFYVIPFFLLCVVCVSSVKIYILILKWFSFFVVLGGGSIFYQFFFGPVSWFAEASEREGLTRFSSLVGSLTAYGCFAGLSLPIIYYLFDSKINKWFCIVFVLTAMLFTLQKAAFFNILIFAFFVFWSAGLLERLKLSFCVVLLLPFVVFSSYYSDLSYVVATVDNVLRLNEGAGGSDVPFVQSILDRLWLLPSRLYDMHGLDGMLFGVGMVGGSGALGFPEYPMAHNGFFDLLFIGGVLNLIIFAILSALVLHRLFILKMVCAPKGFPRNVIMASIFVFILFLINMLFSGPLHMHPYGGVIFYVIIAFVCLREKELKEYILGAR